MWLLSLRTVHKCKNFKVTRQKCQLERFKIQIQGSIGCTITFISENIAFHSINTRLWISSGPSEDIPRKDQIEQRSWGAGLYFRKWTDHLVS